MKPIGYCTDAVAVIRMRVDHCSGIGHGSVFSGWRVLGLTLMFNFTELKTTSLRIAARFDLSRASLHTNPLFLSRPV